jgi:hypothetical protein
MTWVIVQRGDGDFRGPPITDVLISTDAVAISRGTAELDYYTSDPQTVSMRVKYRPGLRPGLLVEVHDALQGVSWTGKIVDVSHSYDSGSETSAPALLTTLEVERPGNV